MLILHWSNRNSHLILRKWICNKGWRGKWFHKNNFKFVLVVKAKNYLKNCPSQNLQSEKTWVHPADQNWVRFKFLWGGKKWQFTLILHSFYKVFTESSPSWCQAQCKVLEMQMEGDIAVIFTHPESISPFPGDSILIFLWENTHSIFLVHVVPSRETSLAPCLPWLPPTTGTGGVTGNFKPLATVLCMELKKSNLGLLWNYQGDKDLPPKETEAMRMWGGQ